MPQNNSERKLEKILHKIEKILYKELTPQELLEVFVLGVNTINLYRHEDKK